MAHVHDSLHTGTDGVLCRLEGQSHSDVIFVFIFQAPF